MTRVTELTLLLNRLHLDAGPPSCPGALPWSAGTGCTKPPSWRSSSATRPGTAPTSVRNCGRATRGLTAFRQPPVESREALPSRPSQPGREQPLVADRRTRNLTPRGANGELGRAAHCPAAARKDRSTRSKEMHGAQGTGARPNPEPWSRTLAPVQVRHTGDQAGSACERLASGKSSGGGGFTRRPRSCETFKIH